jgi:hypothetical protein
MSKANEEAVVLAGVGGEVGFNSLEVERFVPDKAEDSSTDVNGGAGKKLKGNFVAERGGGQVVENETDVLYGKEPGVFRGARAIKDSVGDAFDILPTALSKVLMLPVTVLSSLGHFHVLSSIERCYQQQPYPTLDISVSFPLLNVAPSDSLICPWTFWCPSLCAPF